MAVEGFWNSPGRFAVLGEAEYLDRIESATRSAIKTVERLVRDRRHYFRTGRLDLVLAGHFDLMNGG